MAQICDKCGSDKVIPQAKVIEDNDLSVVVDENPDAVFFKRKTSSGITAKVCGNCGFIELYASDPQSIYSASQDQPPHLKLVK